MRLSRRALISAGLIGIVSPPSGPPTDADWKALAAGLEGRLDRPGTATYDSGKQLYSPRFDDIRPAAVVRCATPADVSEAIRFAARMRLPVVARGGGHSYVGASTISDGLVLDVRPIDRVGYDAASRIATIGGGATVIGAYTALGRHRVSIPAGTCGSVGISGLTCGGGIGPAASAYGLACDNVTAVDVVTADGRHRTVDAAREPDLFWALRGGGGGRFGVVTGWRMRTHPATTIGTFTLTYRWADAARAATGWQARIATAPDEAWSSCQFTAEAGGALSVRLNGFVMDGDAHGEVAALTRAIGREPASVAVGREPHVELMKDRAGGPARGTHLIGSEIFRTALPPAGIAALVAAVQRRAATKRPGLAKMKRMTGAPARIAPAATAFPWHGALAMLQWLVVPAKVDAVSVADGYTWIDSGHRALARWSAGRYVNYLEPGPVDPADYHGPNLGRLRRVHASVDPAHLFKGAYAW
ncbi:FAD-binding oxidoreductase [Actinoplanes flavus]|uniref:FAD-binding oxidoreductase n=1 Tax=Actinoplanes flavus TaxID=2820290 RepID=A0ABS3UVI8_9ACTN|nr:FAD-binding oxidoreductase [Actinoplanes flavus]MBO3742566.1 FAD-binding oxidoreductase [Actinoplanes flavus]